VKAVVLPSTSGRRGGLPIGIAEQHMSRVSICLSKTSPGSIKLVRSCGAPRFVSMWLPTANRSQG
jgi:hypothetical protein